MTIWLCLVLVLAGDPQEEGLRLYDQGRFPEALSAFDQAVEQAGDKPAPELLYNRALAACSAGQLLKAEQSAQQAAVHGGLGFTGLRDFILGNVAFARCLHAEGMTHRPLARPSVFLPAITHGETALAAWQRAASSRPDWPEVQRNVERALLKLEALKKRQETAEQAVSGGQKKQTVVVLQPQTDIVTEPTKKPQMVPAKPIREALSEEQVKQVFNRLDQKEKAKRSMRKAQQERTRAEVEKDW